MRSSIAVDGLICRVRSADEMLFMYNHATNSKDGERRERDVALLFLKGHGITSPLCALQSDP